MSFNTAIYYNEEALDHFSGATHPENAARLRIPYNAIKKMQEKGILKNIKWIKSKQAGAKDILCVHDKIYWKQLNEINRKIAEKNQIHALDEDTNISVGSLDSILYGVGAACMAVDDILMQKYKNAFCLIRPPGHHALRDRAKGFCVFCNIAIAAKRALLNDSIKKVAIIDFDVHQGNGTESIVKDDPDILYHSIHQSDLWPYEHHEDRGVHNNIFNFAVPKLCDVSLWHDHFDEVIIPNVLKFNPDLILVSAGFDGHKDDPPQGVLFNDPPGQQNLREDDFNIMTKKIINVADKVCNGKVISILEGGYNPDVLANCCVEHVKTLSEK